MGNYTNLNVLSKKPDYMSDDAIQEVANLIKASGQNRSQRRRLERRLGKMETILEHTQKHVDRSAFNQYQACCDENMRRFFAVLGICMAKNYGWKNEEGCEQIEELFDMLNVYLTEYQNVDVDDVCKVCEEVTDITLLSE